MPDEADRITRDPAIRSGKPFIRGTRITVLDVLEYLVGGMSPEEVVADFPPLTADDVRAVLAFWPSEASRVRVAELVAREKAGGLSAEETSELDHYLQLEHLMRLAKACARLRLDGE